MFKKLGFLFLFLGLLLAVTLFIVNSCTTTTSSSSDPAPAPSGTTTVEVGSGGSATLSGNSGSASIIVISQTATDTTGSPVTSTNNLNIKNIGVQIWSTSTTTSSATVDTITYQGGTAGGAISYAMTLDRSGSMSTADNVSMESAARAFIADSGATDQGAVINFGGDVRVDQGLTTDKDLLTQAVTQPGYVYSGSTSLYDSMGTAVPTAAAGSNTNKAVIAMTDGGENSSSTYTTTQQVIALANASNIPIYCVGLGAGLYTGSSADLAMRAIASGTGGFYYYAPDAADIVALYGKISTALSSSWTVSFTSSTTFVTSTTYYVLITITYEGGITGTLLLTVTV